MKMRGVELGVYHLFQSPPGQREPDLEGLAGELREGGHEGVTVGRGKGGGPSGGAVGIPNPWGALWGGRVDLDADPPQGTAGGRLPGDSYVCGRRAQLSSQPHASPISVANNSG